MKHGEIAARSMAPQFGAALILSICFGAFQFFSPRPLIPDIAWLIEASRRWLGGAKLYIDVIEVNPPLIFYETVALSAGQLTAGFYMAGVCVVSSVSALWVLRLRGPYVAVSALAAMLIGGLTDFGQRDHLALIFVIPVLLGGSASKRVRAALGLWAFLGVGLKPYLLLIPFGAAAGRALVDKSLAPFFAIEWLTLGTACVLYVAFVAIVHPVYFESIAPLGQFVYWVYGNSYDIEFLGLTIAVAATATLPLLLRDRESTPVAFAAIAALGSFYLQGRNWSYHMVPATGLAILVSIMVARRLRASYVLTAFLIALQLIRGPHTGRQLPYVIPSGVTSVAFLVAHVYPAYPESLDCGVTNAVRYPALWVVPGAWNIARDARRSLADRTLAREILKHEKATILGDLTTMQPAVIYEDARSKKPYFHHYFDYSDFLDGLDGYTKTSHVLFYDVWTRNDRPVPVVEVPSRRRC